MAKVVKDNTTAAFRAVTELIKTSVGIGFPGDTAPHVSPDGKTFTPMPLIGYVHELGSPEHNIPARPFLVPGVESIRSQIVAQLISGARAALSGDATAANRTFHAIGLLGESAVKAKIIEGNFAPLSQRTLEARARRRTESGAASRHRRTKDAKQELANRAAGMEASAAIAKPLIDTGELLRAVKYVIRTK